MKNLKYVDFALLNKKNYLNGKKIIIYGAGNCGQKTAKILNDLEYTEYCFCDQDSDKWSNKSEYLSGKKVYSLSQLGQLETENTIIIIAILSLKIKKSVEDIVSFICPECSMLSYEVLEAYWKYVVELDGGCLYLEKNLKLYNYVAGTFQKVWDIYKNDVILLTPAKVGTTTVQNGLINYGIKMCSMHYLYEFQIINWLLNVKHVNIADCLRDAERTDKLQKAIKGKKIISLVRDPIAHDISYFFQEMFIDTYTHQIPVISYLSEEYKKGHYFMQALSGYMEGVKGNLLDWYDKELAPVSGVNIYEFPFDREQGYTIIHQPQADILLMKMEKLDYLEKVIADFLEIPEFKIKRSNTRSEKQGGYLYQETLKQIRFSKEFLNYYYKDNPKMNHFYTKEEQEVFRRRWEKE